MNTKDLILQELEETSEPLLNEILDFVRFLKIKQTQEATEKGTISLDAFKTELGL
jgi:hypothetical protein